MCKKAFNWAKQIVAAPQSKSILLILADISDEFGRCSFSLEWLSKKSSLNIGEVEKIIEELSCNHLLSYPPKTKPARHTEAWLEVIITINRLPASFNQGRHEAINASTNLNNGGL